jgi:hypothetical protein
MVAPNAREVLAKENELLEKLIETADDYANNSGGLAREVFLGWSEGLARHRDINNKLITEADSDFDADVNEEIHLLETLLAAIKKKNVIVDSWVGHLGDDIEFLKRLL